MDSRDKSILYQVAFKEASAAVLNGEYGETDDLVGEVFALTDAYYEGLETKIGTLTKGKGGSSRKSGGGRSSNRGSNKRGSKSSGKREFTIKNPDDPATEAQWNKLEGLGADLDDYDDDLTKGEANEAIQALI